MLDPLEQELQTDVSYYVGIGNWTQYSGRAVSALNHWELLHDPFFSYVFFCRRKFHPDQKSINAYVVFKDESAAAKALQR